MYVYIGMSVCVCVCYVWQKPEEDARLPRARVTGDQESCDIGAGNQPVFSARAASDLTTEPPAMAALGRAVCTDQAELDGSLSPASAYQVLY